ncbi:WD-repeat protein (plasmid) [Calothrix sp. NIES-4101]|nr:WD-repeat protein [Calothrix sp. NIES-4101]
MPSLKASPEGLKKIEEAITRISSETGWAKYGEDWAEEASKLLPKSYTSNGEIQEGSVSRATWNRFLAVQEPIKAVNFKAFCDLLGLNWEEIADSPTNIIPPTKENQATTQISDSHQDWGDAPDLSATSFYGRHEEISTLEKWILEDRCRLIAILGIGGIGKTRLSIKLGKGGIGKSALSMKVAQQTQGEFEYVIWRSLLSEPSAQYIVDDLVKFISNEQETNLPEIFSDKINKLLSYLRKHRCLIILDNAESVLQGSKLAGQYKDGFEDYGRLFKMLGEAQHKSCVILTSREKPQEIALIEGENRPVRSLHLSGLDKLEGRKIIEDNGTFFGTDDEWEELINFYDGNPLALEIVSRHIFWVFNGNIAKFLEIGRNLFGDLKDLLNWHFNRLSEAEKEIMYWLAISREPVAIELLRDKIVTLDAKEKVAESLELLNRRLPITKSNTGFTLQAVLSEYMIEQLIQQVCREIKSAKSNVLNSHTLIEAETKDFVRESQKRVIMKPIINKISQEINEIFITKQLNKIILCTQKKNLKSGYTAGNVINLLNCMGVDLSDYDFSRISIWQAYLQGVSLFRVNFAHSNFFKSVFTQTFGNIASVQYSLDGRFLAVGHTKNEISILQASNGQQISICRGHSSWIQSIAFSPDGETLASASEDGTIKLWEVQSGGCLETILGHNNKVSSVAFSPDGEIIASASGDQTIKFWNLQNGECLRTLEGHTNWVFSVAFSPDCEIIASASSDGIIKFWRVNDGECLKTLQAHSLGIRSISYSSNGQFLASGSFDKTVCLWNVEDGQCLKIFQDHDSEVLAVAFSPDNQTLVSSSSDRTIRIWDIKTHKCIKILQGHLSTIWSIAYSHDSRKIASGSGDQAVRIWQAQDGKCLKILQGYMNSLWSVTCSLNQQLLAVGCEDGTIRIWDSKTNNFVGLLQGHGHIVWSVAFSPSDSYLLASGSGDKTVKLWQAEKGECIRTLKGHTNVIRSIAFSPDGQTLASAGDDKTIRLWIAKTGECTNILRGNAARINSVKFSPDGQLLASGDKVRTIKLWHVRDGKCTSILEGHTSAVRAIAFSPDGRTLASTSSDKTVRLWNVSSGEIIHVLEGHTNDVNDVCFSPDGQLLATCSLDQTVRLWCFQTGQMLNILEGHTNNVCSVTFGFDAQNLILISASEDETIRFWDVETCFCTHVLNIPRPYEGMNVTGAQGLTEAQISTLKALGAVEIEN